MNSLLGVFFWVYKSGNVERCLGNVEGRAGSVEVADLDVESSS